MAEEEYCEHLKIVLSVMKEQGVEGVGQEGALLCRKCESVWGCGDV